MIRQSSPGGGCGVGVGWGGAIPATDLTINSVIVFLSVFERLKVMIAMALIQLCFGGDSPLGYVKKKVLLIVLCQNCIIKQNDSTKQGYNLEGFSPIYFQIYGFENLIP